jgi:hypothetical protein
LFVSVLRDWPTYLLKSIPRDIREGIEQEAGTGSMAEVIRSILCEHYGLDCEPVIARNKFLKINGTETMVLRLQPELWSAIKRDAKKQHRPHRSVIIEALADHYERSAVT